LFFCEDNETLHEVIRAKAAIAKAEGKL
jgi:hypothetical protein